MIFPSGRKRFFQPKLTINAPGDKFEQEADLMADHVMRKSMNPSTSSTLRSPTIQRKCTACEEEEKLQRKESTPGLVPDVQRKCSKCDEEEKLQREEMTSEPVPDVQMKCAACEEEEKVQRSGSGEAPASPPDLQQQLETTKGAGSPLDKATLHDMNSAFGADFSGVQIHTGTQASRMNQRIQAKAFTHGRDVYFNGAGYQPKSAEGRKLLAHELTHVIQQNAAPASRSSGTSMTQEESIQRKIVGEATIKDRLTRSASDWAVTNANVHDVLVLLDTLQTQDFNDTVAMMEANDLVSVLFNEVSNDDKQNFNDLLRRIHLRRVQRLPKKKTIQDSCEPKRRKKISETIADTKIWAEKGHDAAMDYVLSLELSLDVNPDIAEAMDRQFFHQKTNGPLTDDRKAKYGRQIADNFWKTKEQLNPYTHVCAHPFDALCAALAQAYVSHSDRTVNYCDSFFTESKQGRISSVFHELMHVHADVRDTGYGHERVFQYLAPVDAINNASSYEYFVIQVMKPKGLSLPSGIPDTFPDCSDPRKEVLRKRLALAARMLTSTLNIIGDPENSAHQKGGATDLFFKTIIRKDLQRVIDRFKDADKALEDGVTLECEKKCDDKDAGYNRHPGTAIHFCPDYFSLGEDEQTDMMLVLVMDRKTGGKILDKPGTKAFGSQDEDAAYKNLWTYVAYARSISETASSWAYVSTEFSYERTITDDFKYYRDLLLPDITEEEGIQSMIEYGYVLKLENQMQAELGKDKIDSVLLKKNAYDKHVGGLRRCFVLAEELSDAMIRFTGQAITQILFKTGDEADLANLFIKKMKHRLKLDLTFLLDLYFTDILAGKSINTSEAKRNLNARGKRFEAGLTHMDSYLPFIRKVTDLDTELRDEAYKLGSKLSADKQSEWTIHYLDQVDVYVTFDQDDAYNRIMNRMMEGKPFDPKDLPIDLKELKKQYKAKTAEEFKAFKAKK